MDDRYYLVISLHNLLHLYEFKAEKMHLSEKDESQVIKISKILQDNEFWRAE